MCDNKVALCRTVFGRSTFSEASFLFKLSVNSLVFSVGLVYLVRANVSLENEKQNFISILVQIE